MELNLLLEAPVPLIPRIKPMILPDDLGAVTTEETVACLGGTFLPERPNNEVHSPAVNPPVLTRCLLCAQPMVGIGGTSRTYSQVLLLSHSQLTARKVGISSSGIG
jgi:hypothetical protein